MLNSAGGVEPGDTTKMGTTGDALVGRSAELAWLRARLAAARSGSGQLVLVCGPAGIGKTRLVEELVAESGGLSTGWGSVVADAGSPPLWAWIRALRTFAGPRAALAGLVTGGDRGDFSASDDAAAATFAAETAVLDAVEEQAATTGLLLVLDDLQWADGASLRLLNRLSADIRRLPILIVATHRDGGHDDLSGVVLRSGVEILRVPPLSTVEAETLLNTGVADADPAAVREAARRSGGIPLYLRTLTRAGADQLRGQGDPSSAHQAPEFRQLVGAALRSIGAEATEAVQALSVLGLESPVWLVTQILQCDHDDDLASLCAAGRPRGSGATAERRPDGGGRFRARAGPRRGLHLAAGRAAT